MTTLGAENEALRREIQIVRKEKEAMGRSYGIGADIADVHGGRSGDARAAVKAARYEPDAANHIHASKDISDQTHQSRRGFEGLKRWSSARILRSRLSRITTSEWMNGTRSSYRRCEISRIVSIKRARYEGKRKKT